MELAKTAQTGCKRNIHRAIVVPEGGRSEGVVTKEEEDMDREGGRLSRRIGGVCDSSVSGQ